MFCRFVTCTVKHLHQKATEVTLATIHELRYVRYAFISFNETCCKIFRYQRLSVHELLFNNDIPQTRSKIVLLYQNIKKT